MGRWSSRLESLRRLADPQLTGIAGLVLILAGLLVSRAMLSVGMILLIANALISVDISENYRRFTGNPAMRWMTVIFFLFLFSGINSENTVTLFERLRMKAPFLVLPFAIAAIPRMDRGVYYRLLYLFFWLTVVLSIQSFARYLLDYEQITEGYLTGKVMPTPVMHIRFSLMAAYCVAVGWYLFRENFFWRWPAERYLVLASTVFLFAYLHVLAVRSGLLSLYLICGYILAEYILRSRRYLAGVIIAAALMAAGWLAVRYIPTVKNKFDYTLYNLQLFRSGSGLAGLSDAYRLATVEAGIHLGNRHFWTGVGIGDLREETQAYLKEHYPDLVGYNFTPQSQYVLIYAATGIIGLLIFAAATFYPFWYARSYSDGLVATFHLIALLSFLVEQTLETQIGTAFYITFALMGIRYRQHREQG